MNKWVNTIRLWMSEEISVGYDTDNPMFMEALSGRNIYHLRRSEGQQEYSKAVLYLNSIKWNIYDVAYSAYMIHDGDYYRNLDMD